MSPRVNEFGIGDLVYQYRANRRLIRGDIGTVIEVMEGRERDESHVKVRLLDGTEEIRDAKRTYYAGRPTPHEGNVIIKWLRGCPEGTLLHQEWPAEMVTELGFALAQDPWGELHWLPPRGGLQWLPPGDSGVDIPYGFRHSDQPREITMQTVC